MTMLKIKYGDVFTTDANIVAHGCNCLGFMGAGIALQVKNRMPEVFKQYKELCDSGNFNLGDCQIVGVDSGERFIANLATQHSTGANADKLAIEHALRTLIEESKKMGINTIAIPEIGCGIGGLESSDLNDILLKLVSNDEDFTVEVWIYDV